MYQTRVRISNFFHFLRFFILKISHFKNSSKKHFHKTQKMFQRKKNWPRFEFKIIILNANYFIFKIS